MVFTTFLAQNKPDFYNEIQEFKNLDAANPPAPGAILLVGSSSFTMWKDVAEYFPTKTIINRGFGGSRLVDLNRYSNELLVPYQPKQIIIYCGENDVAHHLDTASAKEVYKRFKTFYTTARTMYPDAQIDYISMKHSPSRDHLWPIMEEGNKKIKRFLATRKKSSYIDIVEPMYDQNGKLRPELFLADKLHITKEGYEIWSRVMSPYMK